MNLISTEFGQSFLQYVIDELRPLTGGLYFPGLIAAVAERYKFANVPTVGDALQQGAKFAEGCLLVGGEIIAIRQLGIYNDGIIVVAWDTESDLVLKDFMVWAAQAFKLREPITKFPTRYVSSVVVEFEITMERAFYPLSELMRTYAAALKSAYDWDLPIEPTRMGLGRTSRNALAEIGGFLIERRTGRPFSEYRYFSSVPLRTSAHLELLARFESLIREIGD